jgi:hypothetical protein
VAVGLLYGGPDAGPRDRDLGALVGHRRLGHPDPRPSWGHRRGLVAGHSADLCLLDSRGDPDVEPGHEIAPPWYAAHIGPERSAFRLYDLTTSTRRRPGSASGC